MTSFTKPNGKTMKPRSHVAVEIEEERKPTFSLMCGMPCAPRLPSGFIAFLVYSLCVGALPILFEFCSYDLDDTHVKYVFMGLGAAACLVLMLATSVHEAIWYNLVLFYHIGVEANAVEDLLDYSEDLVRTREEETLSMVALCTIIVHLVPFLFVDRACVLVLLATAGVLVNVSALIYVDEEDLFKVSTSSLMLLGAVLAFRNVESLSMFSQFRAGLRNRVCLIC